MQAFALAPAIAMLRQSVYPSVEGYWRADAAITSFLDKHVSGFFFGSTSCGPAALSALFLPDAVAEATREFKTPWMNRRMMESSLRQIGVEFKKHPRQLPPQGVALLQRTYTPAKRTFRGSGLTETHWVAVIDDFIFDVNWPKWLPSAHWRSLVGDPLARHHKADSWEVLTGYEILPPSCGGQK